METSQQNIEEKTPRIFIILLMAIRIIVVLMIITLLGEIYSDLNGHVLMGEICLNILIILRLIFGIIIIICFIKICKSAKYFRKRKNYFLCLTILGIGAIINFYFLTMVILVHYFGIVTLPLTPHSF